MPAPIAAEEALPGWLRRGWLVRLACIALLLVFVALTIGWAVAAVFAAGLIWQHADNPVVVIFVSGWLVAWACYPLALIGAGRRYVAIRRARYRDRLSESQAEARSRELSRLT